MCEAGWLVEQGEKWQKVRKMVNDVFKEREVFSFKNCRGEEQQVWFGVYGDKSSEEDCSEAMNFTW